MTGVSRSKTMLSGFSIISTNTEIGLFLFDDGDDDCSCTSPAVSTIKKRFWILLNGRRTDISLVQMKFSSLTYSL